MDAAQIDRIRTSFDALAPRADELTERFYERLFAENPGLRPLFPEDMTEQRKHLAGAISLVVKNADRLEAIESGLMDMGRRHAGYGATPEHYLVVRDTLVATLAEMAADAWTTQLEADWTDALNTVARTMLRGADAGARKAA